MVRNGQTSAVRNNITVKATKNIERLKPRIRYVCDISKLFIYYTTLGGEDKSNTSMSCEILR